MIVEVLNIVNIVLSAIFMLCYAYQVFYIIVACVKRPVSYPETSKRGRYAFMISARNEENVISQLCDCIKAQDYPSELVDIYVVADNCTDGTKRVAKEHGAIVYERFCKDRIGKGYALTFLFNNVKDRVGEDYYDGYFIVDADNILEPNYVYEMNKSFFAGNRITIGYRNSKNYGDNWISAGYSLWFLRSSRQLNNARNILGKSSEITGTGFLIHKDIIKSQGGWKHHLLIEDIEFTVDNVLHGERVAYCHDAILYDEQPTEFMQSFWQRKRWSRGYLQVLRDYAGKLIKGFFSGKGFSYYDMLMAISPAFFLTLAMMVINFVFLAVTPIIDINQFVPVLISVIVTMLSAYLLFFALGLVTLISEWKKIRTSTWKKLWSAITFPLFMYTYLPITASSLFSSVEWKQIEHHPVDEKKIKTAVAISENQDLKEKSEENQSEHSLV